MDFQQFRQDIYRKFGINLSGYKEKQLKRRINSLMSSVGVGSYTEYVKLLSRDKKQWNSFLDKVTINVSEFFRNPDIFAHLQKTILPELCRNNQKLKIWSAACSNGAEPYSVAIILEDCFPNTSYSILGTDIDQNVLKVAGSGLYDSKLIKNVNSKRLDKYFSREGGDQYRIDSRLKRNISFKKHDLLVDKYGSGYDLIICRNVTIYFTRETQNEIYHNINNSLKDGGVFFIGATENIMNYKNLGFEKISHWFYRKTQELA